MCAHTPWSGRHNKQRNKYSQSKTLIYQLLKENLPHLKITNITDIERIFHFPLFCFESNMDLEGRENKFEASLNMAFDNSRFRV